MFHVYDFLSKLNDYFIKGDSNRDPELADTLLDPQMNSSSGYLLYLSGIPYWIGNVRTTIVHASGSVIEPWVKSERAKRNVTLEARFLASIHIMNAILILVFGYWSIWYFWYIPSFLGQVISPLHFVYLVKN